MPREWLRGAAVSRAQRRVARSGGGGAATGPLGRGRIPPCSLAKLRGVGGPPSRAQASSKQRKRALSSRGPFALGPRWG
eukprot:15360436-Alexandrium_andersonii.AAC.1